MRGETSPRKLPETLDLQSEFGQLGVIRSYGPGTELLQQGIPADEVYLIHEGAVKLVWAESKGKETIVGLRWRGWFLGAPAVIAARPCSSTGVTLVRSVVERIPAEKFRRRLQNDTELAWRVHQIHSRELQDQANRLGELVCCSARSRLATILKRLITASGIPTAGRNARVRSPLKKKEMAELIGITPEYLSRLFHALKIEGHIHFRDGWIVVSDPEALATL